MHECNVAGKYAGKTGNFGVCETVHFFKWCSVPYSRWLSVLQTTSSVSLTNPNPLT